MFRRGGLESSWRLRVESFYFSSSGICFAASNEMMGQASFKRMLIIWKPKDLI